MVSMTPDSPGCPLLHVCLSWLFFCWPHLKYWRSVVLSSHFTSHLLQGVRAPIMFLFTPMALKMINQVESVCKCPDLSPAIKQDLLNSSMGMSHIHLKLTCLIMNPWASSQNCSFCNGHSFWWMALCSTSWCRSFYATISESFLSFFSLSLSVVQVHVFHVSGTYLHPCSHKCCQRPYFLILGIFYNWNL